MPRAPIVRTAAQREVNRLNAQAYRDRGGVGVRALKPLTKKEAARRRLAALEMAEFDRKLFEDDDRMTPDEEARKRELVVELGKVLDALRVTHSRKGAELCAEELRVLSDKLRATIRGGNTGSLKPRAR